MTVYIAGKMAGLPDKGRKAFSDAEKTLKQMGFDVLNPAKLPEGLPSDLYMPLCLVMLGHADAVVSLPGSEDSKGACIEREYAAYQGKEVYELDKLILQYNHGRMCFY